MYLIFRSSYSLGSQNSCARVPRSLVFDLPTLFFSRLVVVYLCLTVCDHRSGISLGKRIRTDWTSCLCPWAERKLCCEDNNNNVYGTLIDTWHSVSVLRYLLVRINSVRIKRRSSTFGILNFPYVCEDYCKAVMGSVRCMTKPYKS